MSAARKEPPPVSLPREFWDRFNDTDRALSRVGDGLRLLDDWLCQAPEGLSIEGQDRIGFIVESALAFLDAAEARHRETGEAAKVVEGRHP